LGKDLPWLVGVALAVGVALSVAAFALGSGTTSVSMLAIALIALGVAQLVHIMRNYQQAGDFERVVSSQSRNHMVANNFFHEANRISADHANLLQTVEQVRNDSHALNHSLSEGLSGLRQSHELVAKNLQSILDGQRSIQTTLDRPPPPPTQSQLNMDAAIAREQEWMAQIVDQPVEEPAPAPPLPPSFENSEIADRLTLSLEPIVDLYTSATAHYRMVMGMTNDQGHDVPQELFVHHADRLGLRDQLDVHVIEQTLGLLGQLRQRDPNLSVFVPVGAATLANPSAINAVFTLLRNSGDLATGIVVDVPHAVLASLSDASLEGLATLARAGVVLSLSQASIAGIELSSLNRLNVRFVGLTASSVGIGGQVSAGLPGFVQSARALRIQVIISHVGDPRHVQGLARTARFAAGPAFAPPRKLKRILPEQQVYTAAA
jgi:EAL domain-containing protein (putative c-di-GMP-specific phosphodiesterase class I)